MLQRIEKMSSLEGQALPSNDKNRYDQYVRGFEDMNGLRDRLAKVSGHLKKFAPEVDERYTNPEFETDWHDTLLDLGISALKSGTTNTLTIARAVVKSLVRGKAWALRSRDTILGT